jgi:serpin B
LYFKAKWKIPFEKENTKQDKFFINEKEKINISFMNQRNIKLPYYENNELQMLEISYEKDRVSLFVVLPKKNNKIDDLNINAKNVTEWIKKRQKKMIARLSIPQLKINTEFSAKSILQQIGLNSVFAEKGNLDKISQNLLLSDVIQKTFLEINENGTQATAVTTTKLKETAMQTDKNAIQFIANKPFIYFIKEKSTNAILFIGELKNPLQK